jgi:predicted transcriptional regulator of viral defense system
MSIKRDLLHPFESIPYFTIEGFRQAAGMDHPNQVRMLLYRWSKAGNILALKKGVYMTSRFYERHSVDPAFTAAISGILVPRSYLSLEFVLQRHSILTDITYPITAITTKNTRRIINRLGTFWYRSIRPDLYLGFAISEYHGIRFAQASPAKALFDYLYLRKIPLAGHSWNVSLAEELRLNLDDFPKADREEFARYVESSEIRKMKLILENLLSTVWQL